MEKVLLKIIGLSYSQSQSNAYALILSELHGKRRLPIVIGSTEAQAIALAIEKLTPPRPMTHDLFKNFATLYEIHLVEIVINKFKDGVFFASLICESNGNISELDARPSDAIALAMRFRCPIYTYENILVEAGIVMDDNFEIDSDAIEDSEPSNENIYDDSSLEDLHELLQDAIDSEQYDIASIIRDEIKKRQS